MAITSDALIDRVKLRIGYDPDPKLTNADLLTLADEALIGDLWPQLIKAHADYYRDSIDHAITADQRRYRLPMRAYGPIADVLYVDDNGNEIDIPLCSAEDVGLTTRTPSGTYWHYIEGDFLCLFPIPSTTLGTLRIKYTRLPNTLCLEADARKVVFVSTSDSLDFIRCEPDGFPDGWWDEDSDQVLIVDFVNQGNAHQVLITDCVATAVDSGANQINFATGTLSSVIGSNGALLGSEANYDGQLNPILKHRMWVALAGQTPIVQVPDLMIPLLVSRTAESALDSIGDVGGFERAAARSGRLHETAVSTLSPRSESGPQHIVARNSTFRRR